MELTNSGGNNPVNFKKANQHQLGEITNRINKVIEKIYQQELLQKRTIINAASIYVAKKLGPKQTTRKQSKMPQTKENRRRHQKD